MMQAEPSRRAHVLGLLLVLALCALASAIRIRGALLDPGFDVESPDGLLKSESGLIYYLTERVVEARGAPPAAFRADPRIRHPELADVPAMFTVGQEFPVAWCYLALGGEVPLHVVAVWVMGIVASLTIAGVYGLALELTRRPGWGALAAGLYAFLPFGYRTVGLIFEREELSFPLFALHLWLLARALRTRTAGAFAAAGVALVLALATWHMMGFVVLIEAAAAFAWFLRSGENPLEVRRAWVLVAVLALGALVVPVLRSKLLLLSPPVQVGGALLCAALLARRGWTSRGRKAAAALGALAVLFAAGLVATRLLRGGAGDYSHVLALLRAKLAHLGVRPEDPTGVPFEARLLWQGPFSTATPRELWVGLGAALPLGLLGVFATLVDWWRGRSERGTAALGAATAAAFVAAWLVRRTMIVACLFAPVLAAALLARMRRRRPPWAAALAMLAAVGGQALFFLPRVDDQRQVWYADPRRNAEIRRLVRWVAEHVPPSEAILGDFVVSTSILARSQNPIVLQPKYETRESRERIEAFYTTFMHGTLDELKERMRAWDCRYLLIDRHILFGGRWILGVPDAQRAPPPGTPAFLFLSTDPGVLATVPGFRLRYRSPPELRLDHFRLFERTD